MPGTRSSRLSRIGVSLLTALGIVSALAALAFVRFSHDLDRDLGRALAVNHDGPVLQTLGRPLGRALSIYAGPSSPHLVPRIDVPSDLASNLVPGPDPISRLKRRVYSKLLVYRYPADKVRGLYLSRAYMGMFDGAPLHGFHRASDRTFGAPVEDLSFGEALLLCDLAAEPQGHPLLSDFSAALDRRNRLLARLRDAGLISGSEYALESTRPLSPGSDHRPIW